MILSERVRKEIEAFLNSQPNRDHATPLVASQRNGRAFSNVSLSMVFKEIYETAGIGTSSHLGRRTFATRLNEKGVGRRTIQRLMGASNIGRLHYTVTYLTPRCETLWSWCELDDGKTIFHLVHYKLCGRFRRVRIGSSYSR